MGFRFAADTPTATAWGRDGAIAGTAALGLAAACALTPADLDGGRVLCPFRAVTGVPCPGCGLSRSWTALAHGDLGAGVAAHPFGLPLMVAAIVAVLAVATRALRQAPPVDLATQARSPWALAVLAVWLGWWAFALLAL